MTDIERIKELIELLNKASKAYYQEDSEIMSNFEYDKLYDELWALEESTGVVLSNSPTVNVGYEVLSELPKEAHPSPMLSLDKTKSVEDLSAWLLDKKGVLSWKLDGLTVVLTFNNGELVKAVTRGNGEIGEVITPNAKVFANVPRKIPYKGELVIRGEAVITYKEFDRINAKIEDAESKYKNPRNLASGSVRQLNSEITAERNVNFFAFNMLSTGDEVIDATINSRFDFLADMGFDVVEHVDVDKDSIFDAVKDFSEKIKTNDFPSDGLVLCFDDTVYGKSLGRTAKFPRDAIAFKWADDEATTTLKEVFWSPSRTGLINPVAIFETVELEGTSVSRASLHNISIMEELELGVGDKITVYKANMIIPQLSDNLTRSGNVIIPEVCPMCGEKTVIHEENGVKTLYCPNKSCGAKSVKLFAHFVTRNAMNIDGLSEATISKFIDMGYLEELVDLFRLDRYEDEIVKLDGFGRKSYDNLIAAVNEARTTTLDRLINGIGILNVGGATAKLLCKYFDYDIEALRHASIEELSGIDQIGEVIATGIAEYFADEANANRLDELLKEVNLVKPETSGEQDLNGKTFVITGSLNHFTNRDELKELIESRGGKVSGSVSAKTSYLINNNIESKSGKNKKAIELNVPIISEDDFLAL